MKTKMIYLVICLALLCGLLFFPFSGREFPTRGLKPIVQKDSLRFTDEYESYIEYDLVLETTVYPNTSIWITEKSGLKDSISKFNITLLHARFRSKYPEDWDENGVAPEKLIPQKKFSYQGKIDSAQHFLEIRRIVNRKIWIEKIPTSSYE